MKQFYRTPGVSSFRKKLILDRAKELLLEIEELLTETCYYVQTEGELKNEEEKILTWLLSETFEPQNFSETSFLSVNNTINGSVSKIVEIGPRLNFTTAWSSNAVSICHAVGISKILRMERSTRYLLRTTKEISDTQMKAFVDIVIYEMTHLEVHDKMTEMVYQQPLTSFQTPSQVEKQPQIIPILDQGRPLLEKLNKGKSLISLLIKEMGLAFDDHDIDYYLKLFQDLKRNPTNVELFDLSQSNSEHSRHWFFKGRMIIDGKEQQQSLLNMIINTNGPNTNSSIAFSDNSSSIKSIGQVKTLNPKLPTSSSQMIPVEKDYHLTFTAESHNFPTGIAPFPGAETGIGGRIRDGHATGRGSLIVGGTSGYCVGNLNIPHYPLPWEKSSFEYPKNMASPLKIEIDASNGASDYGNKFGEPIIQGFTRSFGLVLPDGERVEWIKPIMFTGGVGHIDSSHLRKEPPKDGFLVIKLGGPAYRIGVGGGSASSLMQGENQENLDFNAVQRGDPEMEQRLNRVIRACVELGEKNPIVSIHDQGAGGSGNVLKEIVDPVGGKIDASKFISGDPSMTPLELWTAEYQEQDAILMAPENLPVLEAICARENLPFAVVGTVQNTGKVEFWDSTEKATYVDLPLEKVLGKVPQKVFNMDVSIRKLIPLSFPADITILNCLERVLRLLSVGSKAFLTNKVDRSVTGLVAQQQCVGPLHIPLSNVSVTASSHFTNTGAAIAIGEQPIKGLLNPASMARMSMYESLTNLMWALVPKIENTKFSGNWMWPAKLSGEGSRLYFAAEAMCQLAHELGVSLDGGKDSLSMAAKVRNSGTNKDEIVKSPGTLVLSAYNNCEDITKTVTPDLKFPGKSQLILIDFHDFGQTRLGGSALAHAFGQIGQDSPDLLNSKYFLTVFSAIQHLIRQNLIASGHDRSDGGLIVTLLEMAFSGNCGFDIDVSCSNPIDFFFNEELGLVLEIVDTNLNHVTSYLSTHNIFYRVLGKTTTVKTANMKVNEKPLMSHDITSLRDDWSQTSFELELFQTNPDCVSQEKLGLKLRKTPPFQKSQDHVKVPILISSVRPKVAIIREEGSNGDREMSSAFYLAGFDVFDVTMFDLMNGKTTLDPFTGLAFVGGFSYADVMDSSKGWAAKILFSPKILDQFQHFFYKRNDTFSLGVCNGCQLMALLGFLPFKNSGTKNQPRFVRNFSGRFESRFSTVKITSSPAIMFKGMENSILGIWVSHGEGRAHFPNLDVLQKVEELSLAPMRYVDDDGNFTEKYPFNPNGSVNGIAGLCSEDGRHLCVMPHPERTILDWQCAYIPQDWKVKDEKIYQVENHFSPWMKMFTNAFEFSQKNHE